MISAAVRRASPWPAPAHDGVDRCCCAVDRQFRGPAGPRRDAGLRAAVQKSGCGGVG